MVETPAASPLIPGKVIVLDGGMGHQLKAMGIEVKGACGSMQRFLGVAMANIENPELVRDAHLAYIDAGADVITTNSYACVPKCLSTTTGELAVPLEGPEGLIASAGKAARAAQSARPERRIRVAGCVPPLAESYRFDKVGPFEENLAQYRTIVANIAPFSDLLLCETMSTAAEGRAACTAAAESGIPIWVAWTLNEDEPVLRSGESIADAVAALTRVGEGGVFPEAVEACLFNCTSPEVITKAMAILKGAVPDRVRIGGYANGFVTASSGTGEYRDISADEYFTDFASSWMQDGATIVGGCCGIFPPHIARIRRAVDGLDQERPLVSSCSEAKRPRQ
eukprot:TRINITY_DN77625_c0_g1_i1.p1 TRINITY_DN77625_c0_g1~~TRINITY_DN77625_c0_g1_i1.p1  ORF type:complete len:354 (+),score=47.68 TRINITY_DN77625_c0_g1_i1:51-1064(+)